MEKILEYLNEFNSLTVIIRIVAAAIMGGLIGLERGRHGRAAGLRTHILVCIGAAMTSITSMYLSINLGYDSDIARISAQVISGIGFLGAGTILIRNNSVITGLTTAAGMWATAAIGIAIGYGFYVGAATATIICILCVTVLSRLEKERKNSINVYIELSDIFDTANVISRIKESGDALLSYDIIPPKSGHMENVGIIFILSESSLLPEIKTYIYENYKVAMLVTDIN